MLDERVRAAVQALKQEKATPPPIAALLARRRQRTRRAGLSLALAIILAAGGVTAVLTTNPKTPRSQRVAVRGRTTTTSTPTSTTTTTTTTTPNTLPARPGPVAIPGKYDAGSVAFPTATNGFVTVAGYGPSGTLPLYSWVDRSTDSGQHWVAGQVSSGSSDVGDLVFASPAQGWEFGFGSKGLSFTLDAGATWKSEPTAFNVGAVSVSGTSTWVVGSECTNLSCPATIYAANRVGGALAPLSAQPTKTLAIQSVLRTSATSGWAVLTDSRGQESLAYTTDGGRSWTPRQLPSCPQPDQFVGIWVSPNGSLWAACQLPSQSMCDSCGTDVIYQSADGGQTWIRQTPTPQQSPPSTSSQQLGGLESLDPVSDTTAWSLTGFEDGTGALERTTDGGRTWTTVLTSTQTAPLWLDAITANGPNTAWVVGWTARSNGRIFATYSTTNGGKTWHTSYLPSPKGLPSN